jgi:tetratricopeptide (TPR) repeat protein
MTPPLNARFRRPATLLVMALMLLASSMHPTRLEAAVLSNQNGPTGVEPDWKSLEGDELVGVTMMEAGTAYKAGDSAKALELLSSARLKRPGQPKIILATVFVYMRTRNFEAALTDLGQVLKIDPGNLEALRILGPCNEALGRDEMAAASYQALIKRQPLNEKPYYSLGAAYFRLGAIDKAIEAYHQPVSIKPKDPLAHEALGSAYYQAKRYPEAIASFEKALEIDPTYAEAHNSLGTAYYTSDEKKKGVEHVRLAIKANPRYAKAYSNLASMLAMNEEYEAALPPLNSALTLDVLDGHAWNTLLLTLERVLLPDAAKTERKTPPEDLKGDALASWHLAAFSESVKAGTIQVGARHLIKGLQANIHRADLLNQLGILLVGSPYSALSPRLLQLAVTINPSFEAASENLRLYYKNLSREQLATVRSSMEKKLEEDPDNLQAHMQLGRVYAAQNRFEQAIPHYLDCVRLAPTNINNRITLSYALYQGGRMDAALESLIECLKLDPVSKVVWDKILIAAEAMQPNSDPNKKIELPRPPEDLQLDNKAAALWHFREARKHDIKGSNTWVMAARHLGASIHLDMSTPAGFYMYGDLASRQLSKRLAVPFYERADALSPGYRPLEKELAEVRKDAAIEGDQARVTLLQQRMLAEPENPAVALNLANLLMRYNKTKEAVTTLQKSVKHSPSNEVVRLTLARVFYADGDLDSAIGELDALLKQGVRSPSILFQRAWLMLEKPSPSRAELDSAVKLLARARQIEGEKTPALFIQTLARTYHLQGDQEQALKTAKEALVAAKIEENEGLIQQMNAEIEKYGKSTPEAP